MSVSWPSPEAVEEAARAILAADPTIDVDALHATIRTAPFTHDRTAAIEVVEGAMQQARAALVAAEPFMREQIAREVEAMVTGHLNDHEIRSDNARRNVAAAIRAGGPAEAEGDTDA